MLSPLLVTALVTAIVTAVPLDWTYQAPSVDWGAVDLRNGLVWAATKDSVLAIHEGKLDRRYGPYPELTTQPSFFDERGISEHSTPSPPTSPNAAMPPSPRHDRSVNRPITMATSMLLMTGAKHGNLTLVDLPSGRTRWTKTMAELGRVHPAFSNVSCYSTFFSLVPSANKTKRSHTLVGRCRRNSGSLLFALSPHDGSFLWAHNRLQTFNYAPPVVTTSDNEPFFLDTDRDRLKVMARTAEGTELWSYTVHGSDTFLSSYAPIVVCGGVTVVLSARGVWNVTGIATAFDVNGTQLWRIEGLPVPAYAPPSCAVVPTSSTSSHHALVGLFGGRLTMLLVATGRVVFSRPIPEGQVQIDHDDHYTAVDHHNGRIIAVCGTPQVNGPQIFATLNAFDLRTGMLQKTVSTKMWFRAFSSKIAVSSATSQSGSTAMFFGYVNNVSRLTL